MLKLTLSKKKFLSDLDRNYLKNAPIHRRFTITPPKPLFYFIMRPTMVLRARFELATCYF